MSSTLYAQGEFVKKFYTVDRANRLNEGDVISLQHHDDVAPDFLQNHVDKMFSEGFSFHGEQYLLKNDSRGNISSPSIELLFEHVRQAHFPSITSRFQSFFACESYEEAIKFRNEFGSDSNKFYEVFTENEHFKGNMNLLNNNQTSLLCSYLSHQYWEGNSIAELGEFWEVLLSLPVTIGPAV